MTGQERNEAAQLLGRAGWLLRQVACTEWLPGTPARIDMADRYDYEEHEQVSRPLDVDALNALDRELLAWVGHQLEFAARRVRGRGVHGADATAARVARRLIDDGGRRPAGQPPVPMYGRNDWDHEGRDFRRQAATTMRALDKRWKRANRINGHPDGCTCETCESVIFAIIRLGADDWSALHLRVALVLAAAAPQPLLTAQISGELGRRYATAVDDDQVLAGVLGWLAAAGAPVEQPNPHGPYVWNGPKP
jgi:hypothetical protein